MSDDAGRRLPDYFSRWINAITAAAAAAATTGLLGVLVFSYGDIPREQRAMSEAIAVIQTELRQVRDEQRELIDANRVSQGWRERLVTVEQKQERQADRLVEHAKRIDELEHPSFFGNSKKK